MNLKKAAITMAIALLALLAPSVTAQQASSSGAGPNASPADPPSASLLTGAALVAPHGGSLRSVGGVQLETVVNPAGIHLYAYDTAGRPIEVNQGRGSASLRIYGIAKRYRYDLLPDGRGGLTAPVNLSKVAGRQAEIAIQLIGIAGTRGKLSFNEVAVVPVNPADLDAEAIARQKICPVSGKPLGSMGEAVAVNVDGKRIFVCCAGCVDAVKADPGQYAAGQPKITVTSATAADAELIKRQARCPVMDEPLGSMGQPIKVMVGHRPIFLCCRGCIKKIEAEPAKYIAMVDAGMKAAVPAGTEQVREGVFKVTAADAPYIAAQKRCPVMDEPLDAMGGPYKVNADGKAIYICCPGCAKMINKEPQRFLGILAKQGVEAPVLR